MKKTTKWVLSIASICAVFTFLVGCGLLREAIISIPNGRRYEYKQHGIVAESVYGEMRNIECDVQNNSVITSIVCKVEGVEYVVYDKHDPSRECSRMKYGDEFNFTRRREIYTRPPSGRIHDDDHLTDCGHWVRTIVVANSRWTDVVIHMRINEIAIDVPCDEKSFIDAFGHDYEMSRISRY